MKRVFSYSSYRDFLKDFYLDQKEKTPGYTYARFASLAKLNSPNYLKLVIDGGRNLTIANIHQFAKALSLDFHELNYFEALVLREQSSVETEKKYYSQRLRELAKGKPKGGIRVSDNSFVSNWYMPAIMVYLQDKDENTNSLKAAKVIGITELEFKRGLENLLKAKLIEIINGKYALNSRHLYYQDPKLANVYQKNYLKSQLELSQLAFKQKYSSGAKFHSHTFTVPETDIAYYDSKLRTFIESLIAEADTQPHENVVQLNFQLFPLGEFQ